jgi:methylated-DNA-[protein]-cysteine S-methyltransferase
MSPTRSIHSLALAQTRVASPLGDLSLVASAQGLLGLWFDDQQHHPGPLTAGVDAANAHLLEASAWLDAYWRTGRSTRALTLAPVGTPFQTDVWLALRRIDDGATCTYGDVAQTVGRPQAVRAVGAAIGRNPLGIIVPCHRVIGRDGSLTGYAGGLARKQWLLAHEQASRKLPIETL